MLHTYRFFDFYAITSKRQKKNNKMGLTLPTPLPLFFFCIFSAAIVLPKYTFPIVFMRADDCNKTIKCVFTPYPGKNVFRGSANLLTTFFFSSEKMAKKFLDLEGKVDFSSKSTEKIFFCGFYS